MILIVDDKKENLFSLKTLLELHQFETDLASSGEEALKKILKNDYALIILDVQMPGMDGYEVAEAVMGYSKSKYIPIIFLSAINIDKRYIAKGYASGGVDYITKPFDADLLLLKVKTFYKLYEQTQELNLAQTALKKENEIRRAAEKALQDANLRLEDKVRERTKELAQLNSELEVRNTELQQYASLASHDLQEPLRKIATFSHLVQDRFLQDKPEAKQYLGRIISASEHMRNLINDLLNYSRLSGESEFMECNLGSIINDVKADLEISIAEKKAKLVVEYIPPVEVIPGQMRQVFQNIISNALKFSKKDVPPCIKIWGKRLAEKSATGMPSASGDYMGIYVQDNGIGFDEIYVDKIFTIFQRLHGRQQYEGTGIGLAIVKKIVEKHNGLLAAKSTEGAGSTFIIVLPVKQNGRQQPVNAA